MNITQIFDDIVANSLQSATKIKLSQSTNQETYEYLENLVRGRSKRLFLDVISKDESYSQDVRQKGNVAYTSLRFPDALVLYNESIARAPANSTVLALSLGNRAACLLNLGYVAEALVDVQRALEVPAIDPNYSDKLSKRRDVCLNRIIETKPEQKERKAPRLSDKGEFLVCTVKKIALSEGANSGRCLRTLDVIKTGEVLAVEHPYACVPISSCIYSHCWHCLRRSPALLECSRCTTAMFCSTECLKANEKEHKFECKTFEALARYNLGKMDLLSLKIFIRAVCEGHDIARMNSNDGNCDSTYKSNDIRRIANLVGNTEQRTDSDLLLRAFKSFVMIEALQEFSGLFKSPNSISKSTAGGFILNLLQNMPCNAHEVTEMSAEDELVEIGSAAYATLSLLNHSCDPNVVRQSVGTSAVLRAIRQIAPGEELVDNYGYHFATHPRDVRKASLLGQYHFSCECEACQKNWPLYQDLPTKTLLRKPCPDLHKKHKESSSELDTQMDLIMKKKATEGIILWLCQYLDFLDENVEKPIQEYCKCQEAIKYALNFHPAFNRSFTS